MLEPILHFYRSTSISVDGISCPHEHYRKQKGIGKTNKKNYNILTAPATFSKNGFNLESNAVFSSGATYEYK